jgi:hypothetical protein
MPTTGSGRDRSSAGSSDAARSDKPIWVRLTQAIGRQAFLAVTVECTCPNPKCRIHSLQPVTELWQTENLLLHPDPFGDRERAEKRKARLFAALAVAVVIAWLAASVAYVATHGFTPFWQQQPAPSTPYAPYDDQPGCDWRSPYPSC